MSFTKEQVRAAYKNLPEKIKGVVTSPDISELILLTMKQAGLSEENVVQAEGEIFSSMLRLQTMDSAIDNIAKVTNISVEKFSEAKKRITQEIYNAYKEAGIKMEDAKETKQEILQDLLPSSGDTKEQIIKGLQTRRLNAQNDFITPTTPEIRPPIPETQLANLPMVEPALAQGSVMVKKGEVAHEVPHIEPTTNPSTTFEGDPPARQDLVDLAGSTSNQSKVSLPDYRYEEGKDPYREPLA